MGQETSKHDVDTSLRRTEGKTSVLADEADDLAFIDTQDRPLPPTEEPIELTVLAGFQCPFQKDFTKFDCNDGKKCPFGHWKETANKPASLRPLPGYFCVDRLLDQCGSPNIEHLNEGLLRCENGLHPRNDDLTDLESLIDQLATVVLGRRPSERSASGASCVFCLKPLPSSFDGLDGLLENCSHVFCSECISQWRRSKQVRSQTPFLDFECPTCRVPSSRILFWPPNYPLSSTDKKRIFALQKRVFGLMVGPKISTSIQEIENGDKFVITYQSNIVRGPNGPPRARPKRNR